LTEDPRDIPRSTNLEDAMNELFDLSSASFGPAYQQLTPTWVIPQRVEIVINTQLWEEV